MILGAAGKGVVLGANAVDDILYRAIEQFHDQHDQQAANQQDFLDNSVAEPNTQRREYHRQPNFLPKRCLVDERRSQPVDRVTGALNRRLIPVVVRGLPVCIF